MKLDYGMLFAYWLSDNKGCNFDEYVEKYINDKSFEKEINRIDCIINYKERENGLNIQKISKNSDNEYIGMAKKFPDKREYAQIEYQRRLDKVLEKFEKEKNIVFENGYYLKYVVQTYPVEIIITASDTDNLFYFSKYPYGQEISLDTVEHLIKDVEAHNE